MKLVKTMYKIVRGKGAVQAIFYMLLLFQYFQKANSNFLINLKFQIELLNTADQSQRAQKFFKKEQTKT